MAVASQAVAHLFLVWTEPQLKHSFISTTSVVCSIVFVIDYFLLEFH
jgi:hypothetical protein